MNDDNIIPFKPKFPKEDEVKSSDLIWKCNCGCRLFYVTPTEIECSTCGTIQVFHD